MAIFLWKTGDIQVIDDALKYIGRFFSEKYFNKCSSNARQHYCPDCVNSSIKWRLFLAKVLDKCIQNPDLSDLDRRWSVWANNVRSSFGEVSRSCLDSLEETLTAKVDPFPNFDGNTFQAIRGVGSQLVHESIPVHTSEKSNIRITTIHSVKGRTFEAVMVVSAPSKQGTTDGYWIQWIEGTA